MRDFTARKVCRGLRGDAVKLIVTGYIIRHPLAGNLCAFFHYLLGFHRLGHEIVYVEESGWADSCYEPRTGLYSDDPSSGVTALRSVADRFGLPLPICYVNRQSGRTTGLSLKALRTHLRSADLLLDIGGTCALDEFALVSRRAVIDMDPMFTQVGRFAGKHLGDYQVHFTYGTNIGQPDCGIPDTGIAWQPTLPPVVVDIWPDRSSIAPAAASMTTICNWGAYGGVEFGGERYGQKDEEFRKLIALPAQSAETLEIAIAGARDDDRALLTGAGWRLRSAEGVTADFDAYAAYIGNSLGEFSVAKNAYVKSRSGWFSDRSVCYLASGRPVILQDTGARKILPDSPSLLFFSSMAQAVEQLEQLRTEYATRCRAARELAETVFGHAVVLPNLIDTAFSDPSLEATAMAARAWS
jgi:hypothetical protein